MKYRIEKIIEEGKPTLYQPQVYEEPSPHQQHVDGWDYWFNLIEQGDGTACRSGIFWNQHTRKYEGQSVKQEWATKEKAMEVINLHKKQTEPKIIKEYINVE